MVVCLGFEVQVLPWVWGGYYCGSSGAIALLSGVVRGGGWVVLAAVYILRV